jgi:hypothetical protein
LANSPPDVAGALQGVRELQDVAEVCGDVSAALLARVVRLRTLVDAGMWNVVGEALTTAEVALGLSYEDADSGSPGTGSPSKSPKKEKGKDKEKEKEVTFVSFDDPFEAAMAIHVLVIGVVYFTHVGVARSASARLTHLHALLDSDALLLFPDGILEVRHLNPTINLSLLLLSNDLPQIKLAHGPPLLLKSTHPRVLYHLAYLVSSVSKRDAVGRKPRRKVFAGEGLVCWEKEVRKEVKCEFSQSRISLNMRV